MALSYARLEDVPGRQRAGGSRRFRRVLCVYPYRVELGRDRQWPPIGLELIAASLEKYVDFIDVVDLRLEPGRTVDFLRPETDMVCLSVNWELDPDFAREEIRSIPRNILTIVGGRHASEDPEAWLSECPNIDILVRGDGEEIVRDIAEGLPLVEIVGISYQAGGKLVHNPSRHPSPIRNDLYPDRRMRRHPYTLGFLGRATGLTVDTVMTSRGCSHNCRFCAFNRAPWGAKRNWSGRSPESVVREIQEIEAPFVGIVDDNFADDMDRIGAICDLLLSRGIRKRYAAQMRVEAGKRPDILRKMECAGFSILFLGIESAQDKSLHDYMKGFDTKQLREYFSVLSKSRMLLYGFFILGNIGETEREMMEIAPFARKLGLDVITLRTLKIEPYSNLEPLVARNPGYWIAPGGGIHTNKYPRERLREIRHWIHRNFYTPGQVLKIAGKAVRNEIATRRDVSLFHWLFHGYGPHGRPPGKRGRRGKSS